MTSITKLSIIVGILLISLGVILFISSGALTGLFFPSGFGISIFSCGLIAMNEKKRKIAAHVAVLFGLIGAVGGLGMGMKEVSEAGMGLAPIGMLIMGFLCLIYLVACIKSFKDTRKNS